MCDKLLRSRVLATNKDVFGCSVQPPQNAAWTFLLNFLVLTNCFSSCWDPPPLPDLDRVHLVSRLYIACIAGSRQPARVYSSGQAAGQPRQEPWTAARCASFALLGCRTVRIYLLEPSCALHARIRLSVAAIDRE